MDKRQLDSQFYVSDQITAEDVASLAAGGFKTIICNRPDGEAADQPNMVEIENAAVEHSIAYHALPVQSGGISEADAEAFTSVMKGAVAPVLAYCRTGTRCTTLWSLYQARMGTQADAILHATRQAGYDMSGLLLQLQARNTQTRTGAEYDILIVGAGAGGIAVAASILKRHRGAKIGIVDPAQVHYYQPGWTMVGAGIFDSQSTVKTMASLIPRGVDWIQAAVATFEPEGNQLVLENNQRIGYQRLIVTPGLKLDWHGVDGLVETLGHNGVTSNYRFDLAPYTWKLVSELRSGKAIFTQPPMPIKCAGAPQKALYLSADHWLREGCLDNIDIEFCNAAGVLFGVKDYVPGLMKYIEKYNAHLSFGHNLKRIDGEAHKAWFEVEGESGEPELVEKSFDFIHVCPPQTAPDFITASPLAGDAGWVDVDQNTLRHKTYDNIWSLGDVMSAPNAKTAAAARMQAPIVANNVLADMGISGGVAHYNGYGSCPLTVERGKILLAEFGYGGKLLPSFPGWLIDGTRPSRLAWLLKEKILPPIYWKAMLKGREWLVQPKHASKDAGAGN
jgi:sulfide:quinone oxidoreductase